jgi:hypothetical protein
VLLDSTLTRATVVLDSAQGNARSFTTGWASDPNDMRMPLETLLAHTRSFVISFRGDTALWFNVALQSFTAVASDGTIGRSIAAPTRNDGAWASLRPVHPVPGGFVYTDNVLSRARIGLDAVPTRTWIDDTLVVIRYIYDSRRIDTVARMGAGTGTLRIPGAPTRLSTTPLFPFYDDFATTSDGTIAVFHAREYRVEWIAPDNRRLTGARLTYPWQRLDDAGKTRILDSINGRRKGIYDSTLAARAADSARTGAPPTVDRVVTVAGVATTRREPRPPPRPPELATADELPEFLPPTRRMPLLADGDNGLWIRSLLPITEPGFVRWDVVTRADGLVRRVLVPDSYTIAGFAPGGVMLVSTIDGGVRTLHRVRWK